MFLLILIIIIILSKKQDLNIFKYYNSKYICNTFLKLEDCDWSPKKLLSILKKKILYIPFLKNKNNIDTCIYIEKHSDLLKQLNTQKSIIWRFIIYRENKSVLLVFQNHRSLCGGKERIWNIINYILDDPTLDIKQHNNKLKILDIINFKNYFNFLTHNTLFKLPSIFNSNNYSLYDKKYFTIKKFNLLALKRFCLKYNCSINDFSICYVTYFLINNQKFLNKYINVFIPIYLNKDYTYYILRIPNNFSNFYELLNYIKIITKKTVKNPIIKYNTYINTKLVQILPNAIYLKMYEKILSKIDIFISNIPGFLKQRTFFGYHVENIYQVYNSYNCAIESGISSYSNVLTISMNINEKFK